jgi:hypothetical protein
MFPLKAFCAQVLHQNFFGCHFKQLSFIPESVPTFFLSPSNASWRVNQFLNASVQYLREIM